MGDWSSEVCFSDLSTAACVRPQMATAAPSCSRSSAMARPMPRVPPVTMAYLPFSESIPAFYRAGLGTKQSRDRKGARKNNFTFGCLAPWRRHECLRHVGAVSLFLRGSLTSTSHTPRSALLWAPSGPRVNIVAMPSGYIPIFIFLAIAICFPVVLILAAKLIRPSAPFAVKLEAYECGIKAASDSRGRYTVRFYIIAILFVIFDVEIVFLFPWAVRYRQLQWFGVAEVAAFLVILAVGYIWAYKKGALEWV